MINLDAYLYLIFSDLIYLLQDTGIGVSTCTMPRDSKETELGSHNQEASPSAGKITEVVLVSCCTRKCVPTAVSVHVVIPRVLECSLLQHELSERVTNIASRIGVSCTQSQPFSFLPHFFDSMKWPLIVRKRDNFESRKSPKSSFTKIWVLCPDFVGWESFLEWNSLSDLTQLISKWSQMILTRWITF